MNWLSYPRSILMALLYPFFLFGMSASCVIANVLFNSRRLDDAFIRNWGRWSCAMFGVRVRSFDVRHIPDGQGCLLVFNHTSFFDIFALAATVPGLRFGAKIELFRIPVFGFAMRRLGILPIDRGNREKAFGVYREAQARMKRGERIALAPEGTRQTEERLGSFKSGPFVFAINTGAPIVPVVIRNAATILPKHTIFPNMGSWNHDVQVIFLPPVKTDHLKIQDRPELQKQVHEKMAVHFTA